MRSTEPIRVLVVDDEPDMVRSLQRILKSQGYAVETARNGNEAVKRCAEIRVDGVLMDIKMPGMNGVEAFRAIRRGSPQAFVIFMTGYSQLMDEAQTEGPVSILSKPIHPGQLCGLIRRATHTRPVLIVDNSRDFLSSLSRALRALGMDVQSTDSPAKALALFERRPRSVVLLDMDLGDPLGPDLARRLKRVNPETVVVLMSGHGEMQASMRSALESEAVAALQKPFAPDAAARTIEQAIARRP